MTEDPTFEKTIQRLLCTPHKPHDAKATPPKPMPKGGKPKRKPEKKPK
jgi:hypothetical protein